MNNEFQSHPVTPKEALRLLEDSQSYFTQAPREPAPVRSDLIGADVYYQAA